MDPVAIVAQLMDLSARTAPKTKGMDFVETKILEGEDLLKLAKAIRHYDAGPKPPYFDRNAANLEKSSAVLLVGLKSSPPNGHNCGACGFTSCKEMAAREVDQLFKGPICMFRLLDMGIALGSAVKTAAMHNVDNRVMYSVGMVARRIGLIDWPVAMGIPLSASGRNIFFAPQ